MPHIAHMVINEWSRSGCRLLITIVQVYMGSNCHAGATDYALSATSTSGLMLANKSAVVYLGFHPSARACSPRARAFDPSARFAPACVIDRT